MIAYINNNEIYYAPANEPQDNERATPEQIKAWNEKIARESKITQLKSWFTYEYGKCEEKYRRLHTLYQLNAINTNEGANAYNNLISLYKEAEIKRKRIQELECLI